MKDEKLESLERELADKTRQKQRARRRGDINFARINEEFKHARAMLLEHIESITKGAGDDR